MIQQRGRHPAVHHASGVEVLGVAQQTIGPTLGLTPRPQRSDVAHVTGEFSGLPAFGFESFGGDLRRGCVHGLG
ncbi:hypothetical protein SDC9_67017 [bioreactor metagenome]|uniref:Uncharacterized protein n=1 Tax=bioreactor metagenome TaxID=1076179 RepID=A0A644XWG6_9ZZZZ